MENTIRNILSRTSTTIDGDGATLITPSSPLNRYGLEVFNPDATLDMYVRAVQASASAPTMTAITDAGIVVAAGATTFLEYDNSIALYAINSSGNATTSTAVVTEIG